MRRASPGPSSRPHSKTTLSPTLSSTVPSTSGPIRSLGPGRSCSSATGRPARPAASRTSWAVAACCSCVPWLKFNRATSMPASIMRTSVSGLPEAGPMVATIFVRRLIRQVTVLRACWDPACGRGTGGRPGATERPLQPEVTVLLDDGAVGRQPAALTQVADQVPVQGRDVAPARLGVGAAEREVHGAADLLVEEDRADGAVDAVVGADAQLAQAPGSVVGGQRAAQVLLAVLGAGGHDLAVAQLELDAAHVDAGR